MRITGGKARGIQVQSPRGDATRPATDRMREAVFSSIGQAVEGARFIDLFAGTGAYGLEAFSRGAAGGTFVEKSPSAVACIKANLAAVAKSMLAAHAHADPAAFDIVRSDVMRFTPTQPANLIFADPPYPFSRSHLPGLLGRMAGWYPIGESVMLVLELPGDLAIPTVCQWKLIRKIGNSQPGSPSVVIMELSPIS